MLNKNGFKQLSLNIKFLSDIEEKSLDMFGKIFELNRGAISSYISGKATPKLETLQKISEYYDLSLDYLINKDLSKIWKSGTREQSLSNTEARGVPFYNIDVNATITRSFNDVEESPEFYVDFKPFNDCTAYLPVYGDSMYPTYASGEIIAVKQLDNMDVILWGEAHLIITSELANNMKTVKLLFQHADEDKIILRAANPDFKGDTVIPKEAILSLFIIKGKITRKQL
jgi:transcriptional regulator with XRE-family HTH domain